METTATKDQPMTLIKRRKRPNGALNMLERIEHEYRTPTAERIPGRVAHLLDWAATHFPGVPVAWNIVLKAVMGYRATPRLDSEEVRALMKRSTAIRSVLMKHFGRGMKNAPGQGVRATIGADDLANTQLRDNMKRLASAKASVERTNEILDPAEMKDKTLKAWVEQGVRPALKGLDTVARLNRLLAPAPVEPTEKK